MQTEAEGLKASASKADELAKNLTAVRRQSQTLEKTLEEVTNERRSSLKEKELEIAQLRENLIALRSKQNYEDELRRTIEVKDSELNMLRSDNSNMLMRLEKESMERLQLKSNYDSMKRQLDVAMENERMLFSQEKRFQDEKKEFEGIKEKLRTTAAKLE